MTSPLDLAPVFDKMADGQPEAARDLLAQLLQTHPDGLGFYNLGVLQKQLGQDLAAMASFEKAAELAPDQPEVWNEIGLIYDEMGKLTVAETHYKKALDLDPDFAGAWNNWGVIAFLKGQFAEAHDRFARAVRLDPDSANAWFNLRDTLTELGDPSGAAAAQAELDRLEASFDHD